MRFLIAADIFPPESGGPATYSVTLANELVKLGDSVTIVSLNPESDRKILDISVELFRVAFKNKLLRYAHYFWLLFKHAKQVDVVYAMGPVNAGWPASVVARLRHKKFVVKVVGDYAWEQGQVLQLVSDDIDSFQNKDYGGKVGRLKRIERQTVLRADRVITPSEYLRRMVTGWGVPEDKVMVVYNSVAVSTVAPAAKPTGEQWLVSVARLTPWKGFPALIEALAIFLPHRPQLKLKIIGTGPELQKLQSLVQTKGLAASVGFLGNMPRKEALSYVKAADIFILNSGYEGLSHVILEAQALGITVLASKKGGNVELLDAAHLFEFNNSKEIANKVDSVLNGSLGNSTLPEFKNTSMADMVMKTKQILQSVCAN